MYYNNSGLVDTIIVFVHRVEVQGRANALNLLGHNVKGGCKTGCKRNSRDTLKRSSRERGETQTAWLKAKIEGDLDKQWVWE